MVAGWADDLDLLMPKPGRSSAAGKVVGGYYSEDVYQAGDELWSISSLAACANSTPTISRPAASSILHSARSILTAR